MSPSNGDYGLNDSVLARLHGEESYAAALTNLFYPFSYAGQVAATTSLREELSALTTV